MKQADIIIVGSGIAAMQLARTLHSDYHVIIITKSVKQNSNSYMAQGGIAAAVSKEDHFILHYEDTLKAGRRHQNLDEVLRLVKEAPDIIQTLKEAGINFDHNSRGDVSLGMEGAHSRKRIVHCGGDATGKNIMDGLFSNLPENIQIIENEMAIELLINEDGVCYGIKSKNTKTQAVSAFQAQHTILASGGIGGLYSFSSNHSTVKGDGLALAYLAGAKLRNLEFVQFHPTLLYVNGKTKGLISEAVRGEGAVLRTSDGSLLMEGVHPLKDLAPRHIVAQKIYESRQNGKEVYLDIRMIANFAVRFPTITAICEKEKISIIDGKIPVAPGCHFMMGGIAADSFGRTSVPNLYAIGETAETGVHGANRLASNSLLEGLVFGKRLGMFLNGIPRQRHSNKQNVKLPFVPKPLPTIEQVQQRMMEGAGIWRSEKGLKELSSWIHSFGIDLDRTGNIEQLDTGEIEIIYMLIAAKLIVQSALLRKESRGGHYRLDFPNESKYWENQFIVHENQGVSVRGEKNEYSQIKEYA
ncbi:L-aspartate oxidase [Falsibacillus albus]|uniref:L-aspartate oxidase n=1 Tax=Falsibacillus albus TaxID=2478915 RepID=A0A3L7K4R2_9BACI|nr:L-aspartate oxidase [Falsibacillus albus]RLQ98076.1 L-aspartate oxidase [Falsibacillus albus]